MVKDKVDNCLACQGVTPSKSSRIEPLQMTPLPSGPWKMLAMDFFGPFPSGDYLLVVIDEYIPEVEIVKSTSAKSVIPRLDAIFARQGIPNELKTDNGPPFQRSRVQQLCQVSRIPSQKSPTSLAESKWRGRTLHAKL